MPEFLLGGNPFLCDCTMDWLPGINRLSGRGVPRGADLDSVMCSVTGDNTTSLVPVLAMKSHQFVCEYRAHCLPGCHCCDFYACDCETLCPAGCSCHHNSSWTNNIVRCSGSSHRAVPADIPVDATTVHLDGNNMTDLVGQAFVGRGRLSLIHI